MPEADQDFDRAWDAMTRERVMSALANLPEF